MAECREEAEGGRDSGKGMDRRWAMCWGEGFPESQAVKLYTPVAAGW